MKAKKVLVLFIFSFMNISFANDFDSKYQCSLELQDNLTASYNSLGIFQLDAMSKNHIWFDSKEGDVRDSKLYDRNIKNFNFDGLYKVSNDKGVWFFRFGGQAFNSDGSNRTLFYDLQWASNLSPKDSGDYQVEVTTLSEDTDKNNTFTMIGDSITWWQRGEYFRCRLENIGFSRKFIGSRTDIFGYGHEGEGKDNTTDVLERIEHIVDSEAYFLLIGTNDRDAPLKTYQNILKIVSLLAKKDTTKVVYVSTLLPRNDEFDHRNNEINKLLRASNYGHEKMKLIDLGAAFKSYGNWEILLADGLHPNDAGYEFLVKEIKNRI